MRYVKFGLGAALMLAMSPPIAATPETETAATEQAKVVIPFSPPLDRELGYRMSRSQIRDGKPREIAMDLFVTFNRTADGFEMRARFGTVGATAGSPVDDLLNRPLVFQLSEDGTIVGVSIEEAYWSLIDEALNQSLPQKMKDDANGQAVIRKLFADMRKLPDDQRLALLSKHYQPILDMTGAEMSIGETAEGDDEGALPFPSLGNITLQRQIRLTLERADQATATFKYVTSYDPDVMKEMIEKFMQLVPPEKRQPVPAVNVRQEATYIVSAKTGLTESYVEVIEAGPEPDGKRVTKLVLLPN